MANLGEAIFQKLTGVTAVTNLVGTRVYPAQAVQNAVLPYAVYEYKIEPVMGKSGYTGTDMAVVVLVIWGRTTQSCTEVTNAIRRGIAPGGFGEIELDGKKTRFVVGSVESGRENEGEYFYNILTIKSRHDFSQNF